MIVKGKCQSCGGPLEFEAEHNGAQVPCPHCGRATQLVIGQRAATPAMPNKPAITEIARAVEEPIETRLESVAEFMRGVGYFGAALSGLALLGCMVQENGWGALVAFLSIFGWLVQGWVTRTLVLGFAEIIRLLRKP
jgi:hypothetical protein